jgi:hypothetical protein
VTPPELASGCVDDQGEDHCVDELGNPDFAGDALPEEDDACAGMCLEGETCVMRHGNLTCEGTPVPRAPDPDAPFGLED